MKHQFPSYYTVWDKLGYYGLKGSAIVVLFFLILPILVIIPLSFNFEPYFTFIAGNFIVFLKNNTIYSKMQVIFPL